MNILVTGCSRGVGLEICRVLLAEGHMVYGISRTYTSEFEELEKKYPNVIMDNIKIEDIMLMYVKGCV